ncbi:Ephrin type-B receptor 1 [Liparis tanakae]|uniref:Ephrin type-B receptor 1 n=1 Tax=Liparis tanakae TaxID=230148 RepID=A0A4Z2FKB7_9TELE|nr:Ephrin type-B receptor 1 [Liparis tanakae]
MKPVGRWTFDRLLSAAFTVKAGCPTQAPSVVPIMHQVSSTSRSFSLSWPPPEQPNGIILDYEVRYFDKVFNVWLSSHIWLFRLESSQLIAARFLDQRQRVSFRPGPVFSTAACHSVSTSRVAEQIKSHLRAWTGTI